MVDNVAKKIKKQMISEADAIQELIENNLAKLNEFTIFPLECSCCNQLKFFKGIDIENHIAKSIDCDDVTITTEERELVNATYALIDRLYVDYAVHFIDTGDGFVFARDEDKFASLIKDKMKLL